MTTEELREWYINDIESKKIVIDDLQAQLSSKEQECEELKKGLSGYSKEVSELQKIASDQDSELVSLRAENERLTSESLKYFNSLQHQLNQTIEAQGRNFYNENIISELRKRCEDLEADMKENMMIAFTAGHCMVPGDVSFEEWYKDFLKTKRIASKKGADLEEAATKLGEIVDCYSRMDYDDQDIIKDIAPRIFAIIQNELKKIEK